MQSVSKLCNNFINFISRISCVNTKILPIFFCWFWNLDGYAFNSLSCQFNIMPICSRNRNPDRYPISFGQKASFSPFFALSVGLAPVASPPSGDFVIAPSRDCHFRFKPLISSYASNPLAQKVSNTPASIHS